MDTAVLNQRYELRQELGRGGMGIIYQGYDTVLERDVAVKVLSHSDLGTAGRTHLLTEARAVARLNHPNIVSIFDAGETGGVAYIVMELLEGQSLFRQRPQSLAEIIAVTRQVCTALEHAHRHNIIHRDLKPENVIIAPDGSVKLTDFGLARSAASRVSGEQAISGTVYYLAPELALGQDYDARADLYSLGVMLYELVAGRLPFTGDDLLSVISQHIHAPVVPPRTFRPDLPDELEDIILKLMAKQPEDRFATAADIERALAVVPLGSQSLPLPAETQTQFALVEQLSSGRLFGRREELAQLRDLWQHVTEGHSHMALISGEPGVGKTRLSRELMVLARLTGAVVLSGGCYEYESSTPYLPFVEALREWVREQPADDLRRQLDSLATELARLAPEIESKLGPLPRAVSLPPNEERLRLFDSVARFIQRLSAGHGLVLFIDDLHWADQGTLNLLHYVLRSLREERLLVLSAYREMELDRAHPLASALVEWNRERLAVRIPLNRLSQADVLDMLTALFGSENDMLPFSQAIYRETEGNPFFIEEVIKSQIEQGQICRLNCNWQLCDPATASIPQSIKEAIGRRLSRQSEICLDVLHLAAVLGKKFVFSELAAICMHSEDAVLDALDEAASAQLIQTAGPDDYIFTHDKIREVLYEELSPIRRRRLHQRAGDGLEKIYQANLEPHIADLAHHFSESGDVQKGLQYSVRAAEQAEALFAHTEAKSYYQRALECAEILGNTQAQAAIYSALGHIHYLYDSADQAVQAFEQALERVTTESERGDLEMHIGMTYAYVGDPRGLPHLLVALQKLDPQRQANEMAHATALVGRYHHYQREWKEAAAALERARQMAEPIGDTSTLTEIYAYLSGLYQQTGEWDQSIYWANQTIELGRRTGSPLAEAIGWEFQAEAAFATGRWRDALDFAEKDRSMGEKAGSLMRKAWAEASFAYAYYGLGDLIMALASSAAGLTLAESIGDQRLVVFIRSGRAQTHACLGNRPAAEEDMNFVVERARQTGHLQMLTWALGSLLNCHLILEDWDIMPALLEEWSRALGPGPTRWKLRLLVYQGRIEEARAFFQEHEGRFFTPTSMKNEQAASALTVAEYFAAAGEPDHARPLYQQALDLYRSTESRLSEGFTLLSRGRFLSNHGDSQAAQADLLQAYQLFLECGSPYLAARAELLFSSAGNPAGH